MRKINHEENQHQHPEKTRRSLYNGITIWHTASVLHSRGNVTARRSWWVFTRRWLFFLSPGCKKSVLGSRSAEHSLFSVPPPAPPTLQGGGVSFSFSSSRSLRLTGRRGTVGRRAIICSFSHTSDRSHFLQSALSLRYSSTIFDQKWTKDQERHSLFDVCVTVHLWYNSTNNQLDATITIY